MGSGNEPKNEHKTLLGQIASILGMITDGTRQIGDVIRWFQVVIANPDFIKILDAPREAAEKVVEKVEAALLQLVGTIAVPATRVLGKASELFVVNTTDIVRVKIAYVDPDFLSGFGEMVVGPHAGATLSYHTLTRRAYDRDIHAALGGRDKCVTTLSDLWWLMEQQPKGVGDVLLADGSANIFYIYDGSSALRAVYVIWDDLGWYVSEYDLVYSYWDGLRRVFAAAACVPVGNSWDP